MLTLSSPAVAFERDVYYGLTKWLALQAGFTTQQADAVATGDQRVDSGDMQFIEMVSLYACLAKSEDSARLVQRHQYPAAAAPPAPPEQRTVVAGSLEARNAALAATKVSPKQASFLLFRFAEALHALQASYSHQGVPDVPRPLAGAVACDASLAFAHPHARGGWNSHAADLTHKWPADTVAMANATYELLLQYPPIDGVTRQPRPWPDLQPLLDAFARAGTKTEKKAWFVAQGMSDVSFLEGITLPDGAQAVDLHWTADKLAPLRGLDVMQPRVDADLLDFFRRFFAQWMTSDDFDATAAAYGAPADAKVGMAPIELAARLRVWRIRDHGRVADLAHEAKPLTPKQRGALAAMAKQRNALAKYGSAADAFFPIEIKSRDARPLQAFFVGPMQATADGATQAAATVKLRHAPYDTILINAQRIAGAWRIVGIDAIVDH